MNHLNLIWRYMLLQVICICIYKVCCYSILRAVRALTKKQRELHLLLKPRMLHIRCLSWEQKQSLQVGNKLCKVSHQHSWEWKVILKSHFTFQAKTSTGIIINTLKAALYCTNCCRSKGITVLAEIRHSNTRDTLLALISPLHIYQLHKVPHLCP